MYFDCDQILYRNIRIFKDIDYPNNIFVLDLGNRIYQKLNLNWKAKKTWDLGDEDIFYHESRVTSGMGEEL